ncbi:TIGR03749 family integrating conjugative element protein [Avibacterium endocarditidis]|uniref:TIGR03749 family integrating conjugative element protein n=1 Tax=Avibacterium endocarditidis TaxID=380674 RepID=A0ABX4ZW96_9PAST|nr:TIGR03749 family integrating conjugative element protein [Avibacterium endocarditidis]POY43185.1 TIGR03749 family integrating conjugative element protein [Avibacterium endocarditidis]
MKIKLLLTILLSLATTLTQAELLMPWKRIPLTIDLNVNEERIIFVDKNVAVGIPAEIENKLRVQSTGGTVYLKSNDVFELSRLQLRDIESGEIILIDLRSRANKGRLEPVRILFNEDVATNNKHLPQTAVSDEETMTSLTSQLPIPAALTRYAAQSLYAPLRTIEPLPGVRRVALKLPKSLPTLLPNLYVHSTPLESWGLGEYVVTAVRIKNLSKNPVDLDPRYLQGYFYAATFQHAFLGETGSPEDTTVVYLVTEGNPSNAFIPQVHFVPSNKKIVTVKKKALKK